MGKKYISFKADGTVNCSMDIEVIEDGSSPSFSDGIIFDDTDIPIDVSVHHCRLINGKLEYDETIPFEEEIENLRISRSDELLKTDKYQLTDVRAKLTQIQNDEYLAWKKDWLDVTETKVKPEKPIWFD